MSSPFSAEAVNNGVFTKFMSIVVISILTVGSGVILVVLALSGKTVPETLWVALFGIVSAGVAFFNKAAGIADGATISAQTIQTAIPAFSSAVNSIATNNNQNAIATAQNTAAIRANTAATLQQTGGQNG